MRNTLALAAVALMAISAPALAQSNGSPNAATAGSGSNTPGSAVQPNVQYPDNNGNGAMNNGAMNGATNDGSGLNEGRAAATNSKMDSSERNAATGAMQPRGAGNSGTGSSSGSGAGPGGAGAAGNGAGGAGGAGK